MNTDITNPDPEAPEVLSVPEVLPTVALKDTVVLPYSIVPLTVGRETSLRAVDEALAGDRLVLLLAQRDAQNDAPVEGDLHEVGCVARIMRMLKLPDGTVRVLAQGLARARADYLSRTEPYLESRISHLEATTTDIPADRFEVLARSIREGLERIGTLGRQISPDVMLVAASLEDPERLADLATANLGLKVETHRPYSRRSSLWRGWSWCTGSSSARAPCSRCSRRSRPRSGGEMDKNHREFFLRQQLRAIQKELGDIDDLDREIEELRAKIDESDLPDHARKEVDKQLRRLSGMHPDSSETSVLRTWLDWMAGLPWSQASVDQLELQQARTILDQDHYGLDKVKERILEFLAVRRLNPDGRSPILCLVGPPGVGKTSLGRSVARAMGRRFTRTSLGGVRDEAEIRGHRRTYIGALPGKIIQNLSKAGSRNAFFLLDEIDKMAMDFRGDPASALLEVLDPEQNHTFNDHYLEVDFDLSEVMFVATANTLNIPPALLDRMEVIRLSGYTEDEKINIARRHLIPRQIEANGLTEHPADFGSATLRRLISGYTREAGLRNLEREIASVCRKLAVKVASGTAVPSRVTPRTVEKLLGPVRFLSDRPLTEPRTGVATGLAYTSVGGDVLLIEVLALPGKGRLKLTGSLGEVMQESATAAMSRARLHGEDLGVPATWFDEHDLHVHVPEGGVPKDGPSAGVTMLCALLSAASGRPVRNDLAMTGEITLRGDILPVGGIKEKVLAAIRAGIKDLLLPAENERDLHDLPPSARRRARIRFIARADEALEAALLPEKN
jgi:ATP-dependent Lon protease